MVAHVAGTYGGTSGANNLGKTFINRANQLIGGRNAANSLQIGFIGEPGGNANGAYVHNHLSFWYKGNLINPRFVFCGAGSILDSIDPVTGQINP